MVEALRVPHKAKCYDQEFVRTFFFKRADQITIDGKTFDISNNTMVEMWNAKQQLYEVWNALEFITDLDENNFQAKKKEIIGSLKELDKRYLKLVLAPRSAGT